MYIKSRLTLFLTYHLQCSSFQQPDCLVIAEPLCLCCTFCGKPMLNLQQNSIFISFEDSPHTFLRLIKILKMAFISPIDYPFNCLTFEKYKDCSLYQLFSSNMILFSWLQYSNPSYLDVQRPLEMHLFSGITCTLGRCSFATSAGNGTARPASRT